jgi:hypothetical protein
MQRETQPGRSGGLPRDLPCVSYGQGEGVRRQLYNHVETLLDIILSLSRFCNTPRHTRLMYAVSHR